jgi:c-di-GMP-binding flagellar brake protein YcgR
MPIQEVTEEILKGRMLSIGLGTRLQGQLGELAEGMKIAGTFVGIIPEECLMIQVPAIPGILDKLSEGSPVIVRYIYAGNVYGFASTIRTCTHKPTLVVYLAYPTSVEIINLRKTKRLECLLPAELRIPGKNFNGISLFHGVILDISTGGCRIYIEYDPSESPAIDVGQGIEVRFHLTGTSGEQVISGKIQNLKKDNKLAEIGLEFNQDETKVEDNIATYIDNFSKLQFFELIKEP